MARTWSLFFSSCQMGFLRATWALRMPKLDSRLWRTKGTWLASRPFGPWLIKVPKGFFSIRSWRASGRDSSKWAGTYILRLRLLQRFAHRFDARFHRKAQPSAAENFRDPEIH